VVVVGIEVELRVSVLAGVAAVPVVVVEVEAQKDIVDSRVLDYVGEVAVFVVDIALF
jgi:hypothetical protein